MRSPTVRRLRVLVGLPAYAARGVPRLWHHDFRDVRLILEREGHVHYFHLTARLQRLVTRGTMGAAGVVCAFVLLLALDTVRVSLRASQLEQAQRETLAALSDAGGEQVLDHVSAKTLAQNIRNRQASLMRLLETSVAALKTENAQLWGGLQNAGLSPNRFDSVRNALPAGGPAETPTFANAGVDTNAVVDEVIRNREIKEVLRALPGQMPLSDFEISSDYGLRRHPVFGKVDEHKGLDLYSRTNKDTVRAVRAGRVRAARYSSDYGNMVVVTHAGGVETLYGHLAKISVKEGQEIASQTPIGVVGNTGLSTGKHLHFEISVRGVTLDPEQVIRAVKNVQQ